MDEAGVDYALCGGLAVAAHGAPRATRDIDLLGRLSGKYRLMIELRYFEEDRDVVV